MATLSLRLLGDVQIHHNGVAVTGFVTRKAQALFLYLATKQTPQARDKIASLFWPELSEQNARNNLRRVLPNLRKLLGAHLTIDNRTIVFNRDAPYELDIERFTDIVTIPSVDSALTPQEVAFLEEMASLYRGDFLQNFHLSEAPEFEEWLLFRRENLRQQALKLLITLANHYLQAGEFTAGLTTTQRLLELEPWDEIAHQLQMLLLAQSGQRTAALTQYETCRALLATEFGVEPSPTMTEQYQRIKANDVGLSPKAQIALSITGANSPLQGQIPPSTSPVMAAVDLGDMPRTTTFYGRQKECSTLAQWLMVEQTTVVGLLGTGGTGKTMLAAELVRTMSRSEHAASTSTDYGSPFTQIIWRSLINGPPFSTVLAAWLQILSSRPEEQLPSMVSERIDLLFTYLRKQRCLLVLDNLESILQGHHAGVFREEYVDYERFLQRMGETEHRSCLLFTSRELPIIISRLERSYPVVRSYTVRGLDDESGVRLLKAEGINGARRKLIDLVERYSGNPLALKLVAETVQDLFGGEVEMLLQDRTLVFDDIRTVLEQQMNRLSPLEIEILCWLAIERAPTTLQDLTKNWVQPPARTKFLDAVRSLLRRGLLEHAVDPSLHAFDVADNTIRFVLQNVVMEFVSEFLIEHLYQELVADNSTVHPTERASPRSLWLNRFGLVKAQSQAAVRDVQKRLLLQPLLRRLLGHWGSIAIVVNHLRGWLNNLRGYKVFAHGYAGANLFHLLLQLNVPLDGWDFSNLPMRQAELRTDTGLAIDLQGADLTDAAFTNTIGIVPTLAISPDGRLLAAGSSDGAIYLWRTTDYQLERVLPLHTQFVRSVRFSHDGTLLASGGLDGLLCLWSVQHGAVMNVLPNHEKSIIAVAFSRNDHYVAVATSDEVVQVWDCQRGELINSLAVSATITDMAISPNGQWLACVGAERLIKVWNFERGELIGTLCGHEDKILAIAFDPQSERIATGGEDGRISLWAIATLTVERTLIGHTELVLALAFDPVGPYLASNSADQTTRIWHAETGQLLHVLRGHRGWIQGLAFTPTQHRLFTGGYDQTIRLWELKTGTQQHLLQGYHNRVDFLQFSHNGSLLAASGLDGTVYLWHVASASLAHKLVGAKAAVRGLAFNHKDSVFATASDDGRVWLWDVATGQRRALFAGHTAFVRNVRFSLDDRYLISGSHDKTIAIWDVTTGERQQIIPNVVAIGNFAIDCSPVLPHLAYGTYDRQLIVMNLEDGQIVHKIDIAPLTPSIVVYSPDGQLLACGTQDGHVLVFDLMAADVAAPIYRVHTTEMPVWSIYFSPDQRWLAWICAGQEIHRLELCTGQVSAPIRSYFGAFCFDFDRHSQHVFTDSIDNSVLIRSVTTGTIFKHLRGHEAGITSIKVSPLDDCVASSSVDGSIRLWNPVTAECVAVLEAPGPYSGMDITNASGISQAQRQSLIELGAVDQNEHNPRQKQSITMAPTPSRRDGY